MRNSTLMSLLSIRLIPGTPISKQVVYAARKAIVSGKMVPGERFPSVRQLSKSLKINPNTAQKIITALTNEGLLQVHPGIGTVVANEVPDLKRRQKSLLNERVEALVIEAKQLSVSFEEVLAALNEHWAALDSNTESLINEKKGK